MPISCGATVDQLGDCRSRETDGAKCLCRRRAFPPPCPKLDLGPDGYVILIGTIGLTSGAPMCMACARRVQLIALGGASASYR